MTIEHRSHLGSVGASTHTRAAGDEVYSNPNKRMTIYLSVVMKRRISSLFSHLLISVITFIATLYIVFINPKLLSKPYELIIYSHEWLIVFLN